MENRAGPAREDAGSKVLGNVGRILGGEVTGMLRGEIKRSSKN